MSYLKYQRRWLAVLPWKRQIDEYTFLNNCTIGSWVYILAKYRYIIAFGDIRYSVISSSTTCSFICLTMTNKFTLVHSSKKTKYFVLQPKEQRNVNKPQIGISNPGGTFDKQERGMKLYLSLLRAAAAGSQKVPSDTTIYLCYNKQLQWIFTDLWVWIGLDDVNDRSPFPFQFLFRCRSIHRIAAGGFCFSGRILPLYVHVTARWQVFRPPLPKLLVFWSGQFGCLFAIMFFLLVRRDWQIFVCSVASGVVARAWRSESR